MNKKEPDKLAKDAAAARAANMSYGKWKAMQEPVKPATRKIEKKTGVCAWCGKTFIQAHSNKKKYCDDYCRYEATVERERNKRQALRSEANGKSKNDRDE